MQTIQIVGGELTPERQRYLWKYFKDECRKAAAEFYELNRSEKFRNNNPDQQLYMEYGWKKHWTDVVKFYAEKMGESQTSEEDKRLMYEIVLMLRHKQQYNTENNIEADTSLQIAKDSQQFVGDKYENRKIMERFGGAPTYRALKRQILSSIAGEIGKL